MTRGRINTIKKKRQLGLVVAMTCLLAITNGIYYQSVWGKDYQEVLEVAQWEPDEEHGESTPTPNIGASQDAPVVSVPTPKPIPTPTMELVPTIVPTPSETTAINPNDDLSSNQGTDNQVINNQNEQITGVEVVPVNMEQTFFVAIIAMVGSKLILFIVSKLGLK